MNWDKATDIIVYAAIAIIGVFAAVGLYQWITRKSIKKVDPAILALVTPLLLVLITYFVFDHVFVLNVRPDGSGEPSFPSTHTMIAATVFFCVAIALPYYIKQKPLLALMDIVMLAFVVLVPVGRVVANKHWISDCIGGIIFSLLFAGLYYFTIRQLDKISKSSKRSHQ